jgi:hypothetical protein
MVNQVACKEARHVVGVAEVEAAHPAWAMGAALGVIARVAAPSAGGAVDEGGELVFAEGLVFGAESALCGGSCPAWHQSGHSMTHSCGWFSQSGCLPTMR